MPSTLSYCTELPTICDHCSSRKNGLKSCLQASNFQNISGGHAPRPPRYYTLYVDIGHSTLIRLAMAML